MFYRYHEDEMERDEKRWLQGREDMDIDEYWHSAQQARKRKLANISQDPGSHNRAERFQQR
jgi:hypothetical protein